MLLKTKEFLEAKNIYDLFFILFFFYQAYLLSLYDRSIQAHLLLALFTHSPKNYVGPRRQFFSTCKYNKSLLMMGDKAYNFIFF
jgi:hypothetical protein